MGAVDREALTGVDADKARKNGREQAYPVMGSHDPRMGYMQHGMSKREAMATAAMQGILAQNDTDTEYDVESTVRHAVEHADALLERLAYKE